MLRAAGHEVTGSTRWEERAALLGAILIGLAIGTDLSR